MDHHIEEMERLLDVNSNGVRIVGICGMGGIGKTTISKTIYSLLYDRFECSCFLDDVQKMSQQYNGVVLLRNELVSKISKQQYARIDDVYKGINRIKYAIGGKKVLLVLDDIYEMSLFDMLVGRCDWFGAGSRIVVTTRDGGILNKIEVSCWRQGLLEVYKSYVPPLMNYDHSLRLFSNYAFMRDFPPEDYMIFSNRAVSIAVGHPLTIVILGSFFSGVRDKDVWRVKLRKLEELPPHEEMLGRLRICLEVLDYEVKNIFLDIACFFIGAKRINFCYMWDDCGFHPVEGINSLVFRSLVKVSDDNRLRMDDRLRDLGRQIVQEESLVPGERSRVCRPEEALALLMLRLGTNKVEALNLDLGAVEVERFMQPEDVREEYAHVEIAGEEYYIRRLVGPDFSQLQNLRFLRLGYAELDGDFKHLFSNLRWLEWRCCGKIIPINLNLKNLVVLDLSSSTITDEWEGWTLLKEAKKLKSLNLSGCMGLIRGPWGLGGLEYLEHLDIHSCLSIVRLPDLSDLRELRELLLKDCKNLRDVGGLGGVESLEHLDMGCCDSMERLPDLLNLRKLKKLSLNGCKKLHEIEGFSGFVSLELLDIQSCTSIERLPDMSNLRMLKELILNDCRKLREVAGLRGLESLENLDMGCCDSVERLPDLSNMGKLKKLSLGGCRKLEID